MEILGTVGNFLLVALVFLLIFSALIILHELGHFWVARLTGTKVEEFGFGLPPKLFGKKTSRQVQFRDQKGKIKEETDTMEWTVNAIPFGGFVRMLGEESTARCANNPRAFCNKPLLSRMAITVAGVTMNILFAFALFIAVGLMGFTDLINPNLSAHPQFASYFADGHLQEWVEDGFYYKGEGGAYVLLVDPESPAGEAGIASGDQILQIDGVNIISPADVRDIQQESVSGESLRYAVQRTDFETDEARLEFYDLMPEEEDGQFFLGVILAPEYYYEIKPIQLSFVESVKESWRSCSRFLRLSVGMVTDIVRSTFGRMFRFEKPEIPQGVGGPVAIWDNTKTLVEVGDISKILQFTAVLSLSLAVINLVPFPALDGGRLFFQLLELIFFICLWPIKKIFPNLKVTHRIPAKWEMPIHSIGFILLLVFIVVITFRDIGRLWGE